MSEIRYRQAALADLDDLVLLFDAYRQFYRQPSDTAAARDFLRRRFEHGESTLFIARDEEKPLGFVQLYPMFSSVSLARIYVLNDLYVRQRARSRGVGRGLLQAAVAYARELGAARVVLETGVDNAAAQALYAAAGWTRQDDTCWYAFNLDR
jgi:ribosomal protein S18 acetylase RimI-like enzyme